MKQVQFYKYAAILLLILNLALITFFMVTKPKPQMGGGGFDGRAIEVLGLDKSQHEAFLKSVAEHGQKMKTINANQSELLRPYFNSLIDSSIDQNAESVLQEIEVLERQKVTATYDHFKEVKSILREDQQPNFKEFMNKVLGRILLNNKADRSPRRK